MVAFSDMLALWFAFGVPTAVGTMVAKKFGFWPGIGAGVLALVPCVAVVVRTNRARWRRIAQRRQELREKYRLVYRVIALPTDPLIIKKPADAEIRVGDLGWEAAPLRDDGLVYLQGLTPQWRVVWHAGFRQDQIEKVASKPRSQYDWDYGWVRNAPPCPFAVQERETTSMGLPMPL
jgi:hypothetical protein